MASATAAEMATALPPLPLAAMPMLTAAILASILSPLIDVNAKPPSVLMLATSSLVLTPVWVALFQLIWFVALLTPIAAAVASLVEGATAALPAPTSDLIPRF